MGHLLCVLEFERPTEANAWLLISYKDTTGMCLEVRYWLKLAVDFKVLVRGEDYLEQDLDRKILNEVNIY